jgi:WD40 repeat protein
MKTKVERGRRVVLWLGVACLMLVLHSLTGEAEQPVKAVAVAEPQAPALHIPRNRMTHEDRVLSVAYSPDGKTLASGSFDGTIKLWDVATGKERATLKGHTGWVRSVAYSPDSKTLASGSEDETIKLWDVATGK